MADTWEIRKDGKTYVSSGLKNCGYPETALKSLRQKGYDLYHNGKEVKQSGRAKNE